MLSEQHVTWPESMSTAGDFCLIGSTSGSDYVNRLRDDIPDSVVAQRMCQPLALTAYLGETDIRTTGSLC
jgi:hypothetical protein